MMGSEPLSPNSSSGESTTCVIALPAQLTLIGRERIRGIAVRHSTVVIALRYKVIAYRLFGLSDTRSDDKGSKGKAKATEDFRIQKIGEWETSENESGEYILLTSRSKI